MWSSDQQGYRNRGGSRGACRRVVFSSGTGGKEKRNPGRCRNEGVPSRPIPIKLLQTGHHRLAQFCQYSLEGRRRCLRMKHSERKRDEQHLVGDTQTKSSVDDGNEKKTMKHCPRVERRRKRGTPGPNQGGYGSGTSCRREREVEENPAGTTKNREVSRRFSGQMC